MTLQHSYIDIGVNLTHSSFDKDREKVVDDAFSAGVKTLIITGTNAQESQQAFELTKRFSGCYSTAGCHPHDAKDLTTKGFESIATLLLSEKVVAVGECGLDFNRNFSPPDLQIAVFEQHLQLACRIQKPLFLHERDASEQMLLMLKHYSDTLPPAVIHCFTGSESTLRSYLELGLHIGITGWICDERRGQELADMVHLIPEDKLMLETDAPYLIPRNIRPRPKSNRCLPQYLPHIAHKVAECRGQTVEEIAHMTRVNSHTFFNLA